MALPRTCTRKGFTLIEIAIVIGIFVILASFGLFLSFDSYRSQNFRSEQNILLSLLQKARSQSMNNINQIPHSLHISTSPRQYTVYEGTSWTTRNPALDLNFQMNSNITPGGLSDITFNQLTGAPNVIGDITLDGGAGHQAVISINGEGQINLH